MRLTMLWPISYAVIISLLPAHLYAQEKNAQEKNAHRVFSELNVFGNFNNDHHRWLDGGLSRYGTGQDGDSLDGLIEGQLEYQYRWSDTLRFQTHLQARQTTRSDSARHLGMVEFKVKYNNDLDWNQSIRLTAGQFFLPTSMENTDRFWDSPYTLSFSSLNSWIGEEFRPIGLDAEYLYNFDSGYQASIGATLFGGNDSMGALLAYRGWSYGRHRTVLDDVLALPDLSSLESGEFTHQRDDGTKPFGKELDHRPGYAVRGRFSAERYDISLAWVDNMGDKQLHQGEYAWRTRFAILGGSWFILDQLELLSELTAGNTTMGNGPGVDTDFYSAYVMTSYTTNDLRYSYRYDLFGMDDQDDVDQDNNDFGRSHTVALMWQPEDQSLSAGAEFLYLTSKRTKATTEGSFEDRDSLSISLLISYSFD